MRVRRHSAYPTSAYPTSAHPTGDHRRPAGVRPSGSLIASTAHRPSHRRRFAQASLGGTVGLAAAGGLAAILATGATAAPTTAAVVGRPAGSAVHGLGDEANAEVVAMQAHQVAAARQAAIVRAAHVAAAKAAARAAAAQAAQAAAARAAADRVAAAASRSEQRAPLSVEGSFSGEASWYGPGFVGHSTASGAAYDPDALTAASPSLPLGSHLRVCHDGACVTVLIDDRGPYVGGRILDLSAAAAEDIGISGVGWVTCTPTA
jgi:rare lipoprotein A